jgi:hypothetical protein
VTTRTRTSPEIKWLLNERADVAGVLEVLGKDIPAALKRLQALEQEVAVARRLFQALEQKQLAAVGDKAALDAVLQSTHSGLNVAAAGAVRAWANKYGKRGSLKDFILGLIRGALPHSVSTTDIVAAAQEQFGLVFETPENRKRFRAVITKLFTRAKCDGLLQRVPSPTGSAGQWRWVEKSLATELLALAAAQGARDDQDEDILGAEVGGQRAGGGHG